MSISYFLLIISYFLFTYIQNCIFRQFTVSKSNDSSADFDIMNNAIPLAPSVEYALHLTKILYLN